ncbi:hypothetical protein [Variovorax sp. LT1R16]|uniref:hypothetical protein n=1 Tax=Variovorax sp. LT1R16 TaxID=3443728 RepID=UPI003F4501A2
MPDLSAEGYTLVGGRLLPGDTGARAQFTVPPTGPLPRESLLRLATVVYRQL